jgi:hypothetical protein
VVTVAAAPAAQLHKVALEAQVVVVVAVVLAQARSPQD